MHLEAPTVVCSVIWFAGRGRTRLVTESDTMLAFCPYASRFPFETWIVPKRHEPDFGLIPENEVHDLGKTLREVLVKFSLVLGSAPYNLLLHSTPVNVDIKVSNHWHIEILPRLTKTAGLSLYRHLYKSHPSGGGGRIPKALSLITKVPGLTLEALIFEAWKGAIYE